MIYEHNIDALAKGISFLCSGGCGDPSYQLLAAKEMLKRYGGVPLIEPQDLNDSDYILPLAFIGAPQALRENLPTMEQIDALVSVSSSIINGRVGALMPAEIGGNGICPFLAAGRFNLPVIDGDLLGRAFSNISVISTAVHGIKPKKAVVSNYFAQTCIIEAADYRELETKALEFSACHGYSAIFMPLPLTKKEAMTAVIRGTVSNALDIGKFDDFTQLCGHVKCIEAAQCQITGTDFMFSKQGIYGTVDLEADDGSRYIIHINNEFNSLFKNGTQVARCPDIITILDPDSLEPVLSDQIMSNQKVGLIACPGPDIWYTQQGHAVLKVHP